MKYFSYFVSVVLASVLFCLLFWYFSPNYYKQSSYISPVPDFLDRSKNQQVTLLDLWLPFITKADASDNKKPVISATSAIVYDTATDMTLYEKEAQKRLPMASLTKIMTAIISLEHPKIDNKYFVSSHDLVGEDSMGVSTGEMLTQEELLYGLLLPSGNDAAEVLADNYTGGRGAFIQAMNDKAQSLGLTNTHFTNPSGLQGDGTQYTTAYDLLVITKYALEHFSLFREVVATREHDIPFTSTHKAFSLSNETNLLATYPGVKGVKTGYTPEAGLCLVTYLEHDDHKLIAVILNSQNRRQEMKELLDYSLTSMHIPPPKHE